MMRKVLSLVSIVVVIFTTSLSAAAEFSADVVSKASVRCTNTKIAMKNDKSRMAMLCQPGYTIIRKDKNVMWLVIPEQKTYIEMPIDPQLEFRTEEKIKGEVNRKLIRSEIINGHPAVKYEITFKDGARTERLYQWMATDIKFPIKTAAIDGSWSTEFTNIKMGLQQDAFFEIPQGYRKITTPATGRMAQAK
jgi:hypothetical protein